MYGPIVPATISRRWAFSPAHVSGIRLWLAADTITGLADAAAVGTWSDLSGNGNHATQADAAKKPVYKTGIINGRPVVRFDGVDDVLDLYSAGFATAFNAAEGTILAVAKVAGPGVWTDGTVRRLIYIAADTGNRISINRGDNIGGADNALIWRYSAGGGNQYVEKTAVTATGAMILGLTWSKSGDAVAAYFNGSQDGATQIGLGTWEGALATTTTVLGAGSTASASPWSGDIAETIVYNRALSASERLRVERYLGWKYAIVVA